MTTKGLTDVEIIGMLKTYVKKSLIGQGAIKGQDGFSPTVVVKTNTDSEYVLTITDANGSYDTPNLKEIDINLLADAFDPTKSYVWGDVVAYQGKLYKFKQVHSGAWNSRHVDEKTIESIIAEASNTYNVINYGLDRTGHEDCTAKFQAMVDSVPNGSVIYFPQGLYRFTDTVTINKNVKLKGESNLKPTSYANVLGATRPESAIRFEPSAANKTLFVVQKRDSATNNKYNICMIDGLSFYAQQVTYDSAGNIVSSVPLHNHIDNKKAGVAFDGTLPYDVWSYTNTIEGINGVDVSGAQSGNGAIGTTRITNCTFVGFSGFAVKICNHKYIENCSFLSNYVGIEESGTDAFVNDCWFCSGHIGILISHEYYPGYSNLKVNDSWCDQMSGNFIKAINGGTFILLINDVWVDMINEAAIYADGDIHHSIITGRFSRCGMKYAGLTIDARRNMVSTAAGRIALMPQADVISARRFYDNYVNVSCHKREVGSQSNNANGCCPSKVIGCYGRSGTDYNTWADDSDFYHDNVVISDGSYKTQNMVNGALTKVEDTIFDNDDWFVATKSTFFSNNKTISRQLRSNFENVTSLKTMPTASQYFEGTTVQYLGETTNDYKHGLSYDCKEVLPSTNPKTYAWVLTSADASAECEKIWKAQNVLGAKNLLRFPYASASQTNNGVEFTVNNDGSIVINGTATADTAFALASNTYGTSRETLLKCRDMVLSGGISDNIYIYFWNAKGDGANVTNKGNSAAITFENQSAGFDIVIAVKNGTVADNITMYPMLCLASDPDATWTPYAPSNKDLYDMVRALQSGTTATTNRGGDENSDS